MGKPEGKRPLWRLRRSWADNIRMAPGSGLCVYGLDWAGPG